jgi:hypothetical protein
VNAILRRVRWHRHDANGTLPPESVRAGVLRADAPQIPDRLLPLGVDEVIVLVPPQWIGDWNDGHALAPAYQQLWRVARSELDDGPMDETPCPPYRPESLPLSATGPRPSRPMKR